jgi:GDP-L-fucose synthase
MDEDATIYITNHETMIGSAIIRCLRNDGFRKITTRTKAELDLINQKAVIDFFEKEKPQYVVLTSIKMGGILANNRYPAEFIYQNIQSQSNVIHAAWQTRAKKLLYLGSSCIYPKDCPQPMKEDYLLTGKLEPTSEPYAIAKIAGITMCQSYHRQYGVNFAAAIPADVYGPADDFNPVSSHFFPALLKRIHEAKVGNQDNVIVWGTGTPRRECLYIDDLADAVVFLMKEYDSPETINIGSGNDFSITELAVLLTKVIGFKGEILYDTSKPDGMPQKLLDISRLQKLGWSPKVNIEEGIRQSYQWYLRNLVN